jgi:prolyl-tRNA synthetase
MGKDEEIRAHTYAKADEMATLLRDHGVRVKVDKRDQLSPGFKFNDWELKGACIRVEIGPRDLEAGSCVVARRDLGEKVTVTLEQLTDYVRAQLDAMQSDLFAKALAMRESMTKRVDTWEEFEACFAGEGGGGFVVAHWDGTDTTEAIIAEKTKATIRAIPLVPLHPDDAQPGKCVLTGRPSTQRVVFAKAY